MSYLTIAQLSERWGVTKRSIQYMCKNGQLPGATRFGQSWMIPEDTERPSTRHNVNKADCRAASIVPVEICRSVVGVAYRTPGTAEETIAAAGVPDDAMLTRAQFAYLQGNIESAVLLSDELLNGSTNFEIRVGAAFIAGICAIYNGDINRLTEAKAVLQSLPCLNDSQRARKELWFAVLSASIYDISDYPDWLKRGCFDLLPLDYYPAARVQYVKYIYLRGDAIIKHHSTDGEDFFGQLFLLPAVCEPLISQTAAERAIVSEIYLRLICASCYHHAGNDTFAIEHIDRALSLALPDGIIAPLAEQRLNLDLLMDERLKKLNTDAFVSMRALHERLMEGWSKTHNAVLHRSHTNVFSARELEAARLAAFGLKNKEIALRMNISINSVKGYLRSAMEKTGADNRAELVKFI